MKAFWTFRQAVLVNGAWRPNIPLLPTVRITNPLDVNRLLANPGEGVNHMHTIVGGVGLVSDQSGGAHEHFIIRNNDAWLVRCRDAAEHTHLGVETPDYFLFFMTCSDDDYTTLTGTPNNVRAIVHASVDENGNIGALDTTAWTPTELTFWTSAALNQLGITLPAEVDRGKRLVMLLCGMLLSRRITDEAILR